MEIIRKGIVPRLVFEGTCYNCKCVVRCHRSELTDYNSGDQREPEAFGKVKCPTADCGCQIICYEKPVQSNQTDIYPYNH